MSCGKLSKKNNIKFTCLESLDVLAIQDFKTFTPSFQKLLLEWVFGGRSDSWDPKDR